MNPTASDVVEEISAWAIGGGVLTVALFPFAVPILLLTVAFVLPFALAGLAIAVVVAVAAAPILLVRRLRSHMAHTPGHTDLLPGAFGPFDDPVA